MRQEVLGEIKRSETSGVSGRSKLSKIAGPSDPGGKYQLRRGPFLNNNNNTTTIIATTIATQHKKAESTLY